MSVKCIQGSCRRKIDPHWHFCPYCGADNRPPAQQDEVPIHTHEYLHKVGYCLLCGEAHDELPGYTGRSRTNTAFTLLLITILLILCILNIQLAHFHNPAFWGDWIRSWYDQPWSRRHGRSQSLGITICYWLAVATIFTFVSSLNLFFKWRGSSNYWQYNDDEPWWRRRSWWR